ncbi:MAG: LysR family transcriptional regulator [Mogibacterium sp.]|nr:LysR family transcriptional regulator [Mogibacterium sp.]
MEFNQLLYFCKIVEFGSIIKASEALYVTQTSISKAIHRLEDELGVVLLERTNKGVIATEEGRELFHYAGKILDQMDLIEGIAGKDRRRYLSVASYPFFSISELLSAFYMRHKEDNITMKLEEGRLQLIIDAVENGNADIGIVIVNNAQLKRFRNSLKYKNLEMEVLGEDTWYANVGPNSPLYHKSIVTMEALKNYPIVRIYDDYFSNLTTYIKIDGVELSELKQKIHVNDGMGLVNILYHTDAFRFGPGISIENFRKYGIRSIPIANCDVRVTIGWIKKKNASLDDSAREMIDILQRWVSDQQALHPIESKS